MHFLLLNNPSLSYIFQKLIKPIYDGLADVFPESLIFNLKERIINQENSPINMNVAR